MAIVAEATPVALAAAAAKLDDAVEMRRVLDILKMRLFLIKSQATTTYGQIVVMEDALRHTGARRRPAPTIVQGAALRTAHRTSAEMSAVQLAAVRRRSKRTFAARAKARTHEEEEVVGDDRCSVCLTDIDADDRTETVCKHTFHRQCIDRWVAEKFDSPTCPVCRRQLFIPS